MSTYFRFSRSAYYAVVASVPLLVAYELLLTFGASPTGGQVRNAADVWVRTVFVSLGISPTRATLVMIFVLILAVPLFRGRSVRLVPAYFGMMLGEAVLYGFSLGIVINYILAFIFSFFQPAAPATAVLFWPAALPTEGGLVQGLALSLGAGLFEELFFRVVLLNFLLFGCRLFLTPWLAALVAILGAAFLFSLAHYVGPLGEQVQLHSFLFRWVAGLIFTVLYYLRGFAVTSYAHALYDIWVLTGLFRIIG